MRVLDPGHRYLLDTLDAFDGPEYNAPVDLTFVKRDYPPDKYPGNEGHYPGVIMQEVIRALIDRLEYVNNQIPCAETEAVLALMQTSLLLLEQRANRTHGRTLDVPELWSMSHLPTCKGCGHTQCTGECGRV